MKPDNPVLAALEAASKARSGSGATVELNGRPCIVEMEPEPGVIARIRPANAPEGLWTSQHFAALDVRPPSYPDWLPFIPGHEATVAVFGEPHTGAVSWPLVPDPSEILQPVLRSLQQDGWCEQGSRANDGEDLTVFRTFVRDAQQCLLISSGLNDQWTIGLTIHPRGMSAGA